MSGIFLGVKFQTHVFFWVRNMKLRRTPHHVYCYYPPGHFAFFKMVNNSSVVENKQHWHHKEPHEYGFVTSDIKKTAIYSCSNDFNFY